MTTSVTTSRERAALWLPAIGLILSGCSSDSGTGPPAPPPGGFDLAVETIASGLTRPLYLTSPADDDRLFVVEQAGRIRIVREGTADPQPFLDIRSLVTSTVERGLLSIAFHPGYTSNGLFYVSYTDNGGDTRIERYSASTDPDVADPASAKLILELEQPRANHNGGHILFGPDGMLYVALGDGGGAGDPLESGQDASTLLGSLLRLDVDGGDPFAIPPDNPFVGGPGRDEIWAFGLRNPWRIAFDPPTGLFYIADVGQTAFEEVNVVDDDEAGLNFGWNIMEGAHCFPDGPQGASCDEAGLVLPVLEYGHDEGCAVTGGLVYRGSDLPEISGHYFYSDFCAGFLRSFTFDGGSATDLTEWDVGDLADVLSFGQDSRGELYILSASGQVLKIVRGS
jgi:glucose/arabinose dehydrogenase